MTPATSAARRVRPSRPPALLVTGAALNAAAIRGACGGGAMGAWRLVEDAAALAEAGEDGAVLVAVADPARHVAAALAAGAEPMAAVAGWIALARDILRLRRLVSRPVALLDERAWSDPALAAALAKDLALILGQTVPLPRVAPAAPVPDPALVAALALIAADADLSAAVADFRALTMGARGPGLDAEGVAGALGAFSADPAASDAMERFIEAQSVLLAEATARIAEREAEAADLRAEAADRHVLQASNEALERRLAEARQRSAARESALAARLLQDGRALEAAQAARAAAGAEALTLRDQARALTEDLARARSEGAAQAAALTAALDQARAALAGSYAALAETRAALGEAQAALDASRSDLAEARSDLAQLRALAQSMQDELDRIHGSKSWRLTEPLRAGRRLLGG